MLDRPTYPGRELFTSSVVALAGVYGLVTTLRRLRAGDTPLLPLEATAERRRRRPGLGPSARGRAA